MEGGSLDRRANARDDDWRLVNCSLWSIVDGRWSMVDGRWSMVDGREDT